MISLRTFLITLCAVTAAFTGCRDREDASLPRTILVSAAADLQYAFDEIGTEFERRTGVKPVFNFGSSGMLARQIAAGAPADVFASANTAYVDELVRDGLIAAGTNRVYARGRITVWVRADSALQLREMSDLANAKIRRVAIANPGHAPYGIAAREALIAVGAWDQVKSRIVYGENIRDTLRFAETGDADVAIVALSLSVRTNGRYFTIPEHLHAPINQALGVISRSARDRDARAFCDFVRSREGQRILRKYGFEIPRPSAARKLAERNGRVVGSAYGIRTLYSREQFARTLHKLHGGPIRRCARNVPTGPRILRSSSSRDAAVHRQ